MFSRSAEMLENVFMKICMKTLSFKVNMKGCQSLKFSYSCQSTATVRKRKKHTEILKKRPKSAPRYKSIFSWSNIQEWQEAAGSFLKDSLYFKDKQILTWAEYEWQLSAIQPIAIELIINKARCCVYYDLRCGHASFHCCRKENLPRPASFQNMSLLKYAPLPQKYLSSN